MLSTISANSSFIHRIADDHEPQKVSPQRLAGMRAYYQANKEKIRAYQAKWREENRERRRIYQREWARGKRALRMSAP